MNPRLSRKLLLVGRPIFAIIGAISVFTFVTNYTNAKREENESNVIWAPPVDVPYGPEATERLALGNLGSWNIVMCWPSDGGIIVNTHVSSVELDYLGLPRFESSPRSSSASEEDEFCRKLRRTGGKWWENYYEYEEAEDSRLRTRSKKEREALLLGWPSDGGVWVLRETDWYNFYLVEGIWRMRNAHTMDERCKALEVIGAVYYQNPEDCEYVKPLLEGFGKHEREEESNYYRDAMRDYPCSGRAPERFYD